MAGVVESREPTPRDADIEALVNKLNIHEGNWGTVRQLVVLIREARDERDRLLAAARALLDAEMAARFDKAWDALETQVRAVER